MTSFFSTDFNIFWKNSYESDENDEVWKKKSIVWI